MVGGPSVNLINKDFLKSKALVVTNYAFKTFPINTYNHILFHFSDDMFYDWHKADIDAYEGLKTTCGFSSKWKKRNVIKFNKKDEGGLSLIRDTVAGSSSGHQSINLAYFLGFDKIYLVGYDCNPSVTNPNYHSEHKRQTAVDRYESCFIPQFNKMAKELYSKTIQIYNTNFDSNIKCFDFKKIKGLYNE